jgi:hypothetical protein
VFRKHVLAAAAAAAAVVVVVVAVVAAADAFTLLTVRGIISLYLLSFAPIQHCCKDCCLQ